VYANGNKYNGEWLDGRCCSLSLSLSLFSLSLSLSHTHTHRSGEATGKQAAKLHQLHQLLREHICAGVLSLGNKCTFVLEYDV